MDPVTTAIVTALVSGAAGGMVEMGKKGLVEAYQALKALLKKKFGHEGDLAHAVDALEAKPDSKARQEVLQEEVAASHADSDPEIVRMAQALLALSPHTSEGEQHWQQASGHHIAQADRGGSATVSTHGA